MQIIKYLTKNSITILLFSIFSLFLTACDGLDNTSDSASKKRIARPLPAVEVAEVMNESMNHKMTVTGTLDPFRTVRFFNQAQGILESLPFYEGDKVNKGDLLARMDDTIFRAQYNKADATLKQSIIDYGRLEKLSKSNLTSKELLIRAKTKVALDKAEYNLQKKRLSYTQIKAPWAGIVSERLAEPGDVLPLHTQFMSLIDTSSLIVKVPLSELHLNQIKLHDAISYQVDALGKKIWQGNIYRIYPNINAKTRKGLVEVKLSPVPKGARPGQLARISLVTANKTVLVVPLSAIRYDQLGAYVFSIDAENKIARKNIITGRKYPQKMEILSGLNVGDKVVSKGLFGLRDGKKVNIINSPMQE